MIGAAAAALPARVIDALRHHTSALASIGLRGIGVIAAFAVTIIIGRWYGPHASGQYAIVIQTGTFLSIVAVGGMDMAVTREFSRSVVEGVRLSRSALLRVTGQAMAVALLLIVVLIAGGGHLLRLMGRDTLPDGAVGVVCLVLAARALTRITAAILRSQRDHALAQAVESLLIPVLTIALFFVFPVSGVNGILWATAAAGVLAAAIGIAATLRHTGSGPDTLRVSGRAIYATAIPLWGVAITNSLGEWYGLATVSAMGGVSDAGLFRVAAQFAGTITIITIGLFGPVSAHISAAGHARDSAEMARLAREAIRLSSLLILPFAVLCFIFAPQLLRVVGPEFVAAAPVLRTMLVGQVAFSSLSVAGLVLALTGRSKFLFMISIVQVIVIVLGAPAAALGYRALGVSALISATMVAVNVAFVLVAKYKAGIDVLRGRAIGERQG
jgi:O-antigen/teichoic acid export membrane protein